MYSYVQSLSLNMCSLSDSAGVYLGEFLSKSKTIQYLNISSNHFGLATANAISFALEENTKLEILKMSFNALTIDGTHVLVNACATNKTLRELWLQNTCWENIGNLTNEQIIEKNKPKKRINKNKKKSPRKHSSKTTKKKTSKKRDPNAIPFHELPLEIQFPNWRPAIPADFASPLHTERVLELFNFSKITIQSRSEYLMLSLKFPHEPSMLSMLGTDEIEILESSDESEEDEIKKNEHEHDEEYRSAFTWRTLETDSQG